MLWPMDYLSLTACPTCRGALTSRNGSVVCAVCHTPYTVQAGKVFFTDVPEDYEGSGVTSTQNHGTWSEWRRKNFLFYKRELADISSSAAVLDFGVGPGQFRELTRRFKTTVGVDFRAFEPVQVVADLTKPLPFKDAAFDVVISSNTFEHLPNTEEILKEVFRILKPGGVLLATIPFMMRLHQKPYDYNRYTHYKWEWLAHQTGFKNVVVEALSEPRDVYATVQRHFYTYVISSVRERSGMLRLPLLLLVKVLWKCEQMKIALLRRVYAFPAQTPDFTEGYALVAKK